jgi:hypothetical protein
VNCYSDILATLNESCRACLHGHLSAPTADPKWAQIIDNIKRETALPTIDFQSLLERFVGEIGDGKAQMEAWKQACWRHQRKGAKMPASQRPKRLGRAIPLQNYAALLASASIGIEDEESTAARLAAELATTEGGLVSRRLQRLCRTAKVGGTLIWATFHEAAAATAQDPFFPLPQTFSDITDGLGLGHFRESPVPLVLLTYEADAEGAAPALHRPTVADAADGSYYRPHTDPSHAYGYTLPLSNQQSKKPEIVHESIPGSGLVFPFKVVYPTDSQVTP